MKGNIGELFKILIQNVFEMGEIFWIVNCWCS